MSRSGKKELALVAESGYRRWPPRLPGQPIFYPVCNQQYAEMIAQQWNTKGGSIGYVTRFEVDANFLGKYETHIVGSSVCEEYWIPAGELEAFNDAIVGKIEVIGEFREPGVAPS